MAGRMPVLGEHDVREFLRQGVDQRHDLVAARHGEAAARTKIVLHVDDEQNVARGDLLAHFAGARRRSTSAAIFESASAISTG